MTAPVHAFTDAQAAHAVEVVLGLMKKRRFFLYQHTDRINRDPGYRLDCSVFEKALVLDRDIREAYARARKLAENEIARVERNLEIAPPDLSGNKQVVECKQYGGGLDICRVYPLTVFAKFVPSSLQKLTEQCIKDDLLGENVNDITPNQLRARSDFATGTAKKIWAQLETMNIRHPNNARCVVMMRTRFDCDSVYPDFMLNKVSDIQPFPHALGYLFLRYADQFDSRLNEYVTFSTARKSHVVIRDWNFLVPAINYRMEGGYDCPVLFATVL